KANARSGVRGRLLGTVKEATDDPCRLARVFLERRHMYEGVQTLRFWQDEWHRWNGSCYESLAGEELRAGLFQHIKAEFDELCRTQTSIREKEEAAGEAEAEVKKKPPRAKKV